MKKSILSLVLVMAMCLSLFVPAFATEETPTIFSTDYVDALGDKYTLTCEDNDGHITSTILNADGDIVSKAEAVRAVLQHIPSNQLQYIICKIS